MNDQARLLRELMERKRQTPRREPAPSTGFPCSLAFLSGKGGVGKTTLALNTALALQARGKRVCLWDLGGNANFDLHCGIECYWDFSHVLTGARRLSEVVIPGPDGLHLLPGMAALSEIAAAPHPSVAGLLDQLSALEANYDTLVLDLPTGVSTLTRRLVRLVDRALLVTTPDPTAIADTYAAVKTLSRTGGCTCSLLVNMVDSAQQAFDVIDRLQQTSRLFLHNDLESAGFVPVDPQVPRAVTRRQPVLISDPAGSASEAIRGLAARCLEFESRDAPRQSFAARAFPEIPCPAKQPHVEKQFASNE